MKNQYNHNQITVDEQTREKFSIEMIISTGQGTDIPAFYSDWFANRLREGDIGEILEKLKS